MNINILTGKFFFGLDPSIKTAVEVSNRISLWTIEQKLVLTQADDITSN